MPGGSETQKMLRQRCILKGKKLAGIAKPGHFVDANTKIHSDDGRRHDAEGQQPLENTSALTAASMLPGIPPDTAGRLLRSIRRSRLATTPED